MSFLKHICKDKKVLDIGCWGDPLQPMLSPAHFAIKEVAKEVVGVDLIKVAEDGYIVMDIEKDDWSVLPTEVDVVVCSEIIEHLLNVGNFMENLKMFDCPIVITTPNPWSGSRNFLMGVGVENTPDDHLSYVSYGTFRNLCEATGFTLKSGAYCVPQLNTCWLSSGLIFIIEKEKNEAT